MGNICISKKHKIEINETNTLDYKTFHYETFPKVKNKNKSITWKNPLSEISN